MKHIVSVVVCNNSGVLSRVSSLFGRRGFNIDSLSVATTDDPKISRITITARGDEDTLDQIIKQTSKLEETINVTALKEEDSVCRELILVKVVTTGQFDNSIVQLADEFGALILDITSKSMILELTGTSRKIDNFAAAISDQWRAFFIQAAKWFPLNTPPPTRQALAHRSRSCKVKSPKSAVIRGLRYRVAWEARFRATSDVNFSAL